MKNHVFHINGMHCKACVMLTESELREDPRVSRVRASLEAHTVEVAGDFGQSLPEDIARELSRRLSRHGYSLALERERKAAKWSDFRLALPIALGFAALFVLLQKIGLIDLVNAESVSYGTAFAVGIVASLSTCMAVVGGLVLSMSATFAREGDRTRPQVLFHIARLVAFFVLGGAIGALGSSFALGATGTFTLSLLVGLVMLALGINLLGVFHWSKRLVPAMPAFISRRALGISKLNHSLTPLLVGVATFFLPCGFTQSMQIYTLSAGSFLAGGLTMLVFALGTLPVLALISFSSFSIRNSSRSGVFFKAAGLVVIMFALLNIASALAAAGVIPPLFNL